MSLEPLAMFPTLVQLRVGIRVACETILPITDPNALVGNKHFTKEGYIQSVLKDFKSFEATLHSHMLSQAFPRKWCIFSETRVPRRDLQEMLDSLLTVF